MKELTPDEIDNCVLWAPYWRCIAYPNECTSDKYYFNTTTSHINVYNGIVYACELHIKVSGFSARDGYRKLTNKEAFYLRIAR